MDQRILHCDPREANLTTPKWTCAFISVRTRLEVLPLAAPAIKQRTSGALVGLGQVFEIAKASDALEFLATTTPAGQDTAATAAGSSIRSRLYSVRGGG